MANSNSGNDTFRNLVILLTALLVIGNVVKNNKDNKVLAGELKSTRDSIVLLKTAYNNKMNDESKLKKVVDSLRELKNKIEPKYIVLEAEIRNAPNNQQGKINKELLSKLGSDTQTKNVNIALLNCIKCNEELALEKQISAALDTTLKTCDAALHISEGLVTLHEKQTTIVLDSLTKLNKKHDKLEVKYNKQEAKLDRVKTKRNIYGVIALGLATWEAVRLGIFK